MIKIILCCSMVIFVNTVFESSILGMGGAPILPASGITEISLERTACYGTCPVYKLTLRSDGTASYVGKEHAQLRGEWKGTISRVDFQELLAFAKMIDYFSLDSRYTKPVTDSPTAITTITEGAVTKAISDYANAGPLKLEGFEAAIDVVGTKSDLKQVK